MILWRVDDLHFCPHNDKLHFSLHTLQKYIYLFESFRKQLNLSLITRYRHCDFSEHPILFRNIMDFNRRGHTVLSHGAFHDEEKPYTSMTSDEITEELNFQRQDFKAMGLKFRWFCYPFNHRNQMTNNLVSQAGLAIVQEKYAHFTKISTVTKWKHPDLSPEKLELLVKHAEKGDNIMVEDHIWFYKNDWHFKILKNTLDRLKDISFISEKL